MKKRIKKAATTTKNAMVNNWQTTLSGFITAAAVFIASEPAGFDFPDQIVSIAKFVVVGGLATMGIASKDSNKTGVTTTPPNTITPPPSPEKGVGG